MNNVVLIGRLTKDPELTYIQGSGTAVAKFTIAINRDYKDKNGNYPVDFIPIEVIGKSAEYVSNYIQKGRLVALQGSIRIERYEDKNGDNKTFTKVVTQKVRPLEKAKDNNNANSNNNAEFEVAAIEDDEIPF